jgi:hypothetical protein
MIEGILQVVGVFLLVGLFIWAGYNIEKWQGGE